MSPPTAGEQPGEITWGEMFSVLPFGNRTVIETLTGAQLTEGSSTESRRSAIPAIATGRSPRCPGSSSTSPATGRPWCQRNLEGPGTGGPLTPVGPADTVRIVTNDFMFTGGDGYTAFAGGVDVLQPGDDLLQVAIDFTAANSPVTAEFATRTCQTNCRITRG